MIYLRPSRKIDSGSTQGGGGVDDSITNKFILYSDKFVLHIESSNGTKLDRNTKGTKLTARLFSSDGVDISDKVDFTRPHWQKRGGKVLGVGWTLDVTQDMLGWHNYIVVQVPKIDILSAIAHAEGKLYPIKFSKSLLSAEIAIVSELPIYRDILNPNIIANPIKNLLVKDSDFIKATKASPFAFNLLRGGGKAFHRAKDANSNYKVHSWRMDEMASKGDWYTVVAKIKFDPKAQGKSWAALYLGGSSELWDAGQDNGRKRTEARDGVYVFQRRITAAANELILYQGGNGWGADPVEHRGCELHVDWICAYKGMHANPPLEFVPHKSEIKGDKGDTPDPKLVAVAFSQSDECKKLIAKQIKPTVDALEAMEPIWTSITDPNDSISLPYSEEIELGKTYIFDFAVQTKCSERYGSVTINMRDQLVDSRMQEIHGSHFGEYVTIEAPISACGGSYYEFMVIQICKGKKCRHAWLWVNYLDLTISDRVSKVEKVASNVVGFNASHWKNGGWYDGHYSADKSDGFIYVRSKSGLTAHTVTLPSDAELGTIIYIRTAMGATCTITAGQGNPISGRRKLVTDELAMCVCSQGKGKEWIISVTKLD